MAAELGDRHDELAAWIHIGQLHVREEAGVGQAKAGLAQDALKRALALAVELGDKEQIRHCHHELARLFKAQGDFEQALRHHEQYHDSDRAIYGERADLGFKTLQVIHETESARQEAEIARFRNVSLEKEIEERRRVEAALRESETRFRLLMEESPIGVHIYGPDGTLLHANHAWREMWDFGERFRVGKFNILHSRVLGQLGMRELVERAFYGESVQLPEVKFDPPSLGLPAPRRGGVGSRILRAQAYSLMDEESELKNVSPPFRTCDVAYATGGEIRFFRPGDSQAKSGGLETFLSIHRSPPGAGRLRKARNHRRSDRYLGRRSAAHLRSLFHNKRAGQRVGVSRRPGHRARAQGGACCAQ